jgi:hypothetical protein
MCKHRGNDKRFVKADRHRYKREVRVEVAQAVY